MFIFAPFISSTGLVVVAEASLRCGGFLSEKSCRHSAGSFSFFLVLTNQTFLEFWQIWKTELPFWVDNALFTCWWYLGVLSFWFQFFLWNRVLCAYQWCSFSRYKFFHFWSVSGWCYHFTVFLFIHLFSSSGVVVVAQVILRWSVFVSIKLSQIGSFHELLVLATECFFSFDIFEKHSDAFLGC